MLTAILPSVFRWTNAAGICLGVHNCLLRWAPPLYVAMWSKELNLPIRLMSLKAGPEGVMSLSMESFQGKGMGGGGAWKINPGSSLFVWKASSNRAIVLQGQLASWLHLHWTNLKSKGYSGKTTQGQLGGEIGAVSYTISKERKKLSGDRGKVE